MAKKNQKYPKSYGTPPQDKRLGRMVMLSGLLHAGLLLALVSAADPSRPKPWTPQSYTVSLVAPAVLGLDPEPPPDPSPKKVESPAAAPAPTPKRQSPKVEAKKKPEAEKKLKVAQPKKKKSVNAALKKKPLLKKAPLRTAVKKPQTRKLEQAKKPPPQSLAPQEPETQRLGPEDREQRITAALAKIRQRVQTDRRQAAETSHSPSASEGGGGDTLRGLPFILYTQEVKQRVKKSWIVAEHKSGLTAVVRFGILANGEVVEVELVERSGDRIFDESAIRAVRKVDPLPPPPEAYRNEFTRQKIEVVFGETRRVRSQRARSE